MALKKKYVVQKSFRIDAELERDLEALSQMLGRPQNELVNYALELLMADNKIWFAENMLVDYFYGFFEGGHRTNLYRDNNVTISIVIRDDYKIDFSFIVTKEDRENKEEFHEIYEDNDDSLETIKSILRTLATEVIFCGSEELINKYCETRLNYK